MLSYTVVWLFKFSRSLVLRALRSGSNFGRQFAKTARVSRRSRGFRSFAAERFNGSSRVQKTLNRTFQELQNDVNFIFLN